MKEQQDKLKYPIGQFEYGKPYSLDDTRKHIKILSKFPKDLKNALKKLKSGELEKTYRPEGWTVRQVVNHLADSHLNAYIRFKLAVTENTPIIKPYEEQLWAELEDGKHGSVKTSLKLISALHSRWSDFLKSLQEDDLEKGYYHPASKRTVLLQEAIGLYVWHSQHHLAHIYLVIDGKSKNAIGKKAEEEAKADTDSKPKSVAPVQAPKKRTITAEHREKIRAAQKARHSKATPAAAAPLASAEAPKRGRKPGVKAAAAAPLASAEAPKRGRKPGVKAAAAAPVASTEAPKRGRKPGVKAAATASDAPVKRKRRTKAEMQADNAAAAASRIIGPLPPKKRKVASETAIIETKILKDAPAPPAAKPAKTPKPAKAAKAPAGENGEAPKRRGLSAERMAEIRALRGTKKTTDPLPVPEKTPKPAKVAKAPKAAKAPAGENGEAPKRRGLSPERMAEIRAMRGKKKE
jgi:uncharacterized damage-inducible protein DinB